jgi:DNA adenine methylase
MLFKYPGAKNRMADFIISLFPDNYEKMTYLEPFFGSGSVFFRKTPSEIETINDIDQDIYNLFFQIRNNAEELSRLINYTPWSRKEWEQSYIKTNSDIENARRFLVRFWFSIGAKSYTKTGFSYNIKDAANGNLSSFSKNLPAMIIEASGRLKSKNNNLVQIENKNAIVLIEKYNRENVLMYIDPPYVKNTRGCKYIYKHDMADEDHIELCNILNSSLAKIIISGYENSIYENYLTNFNKTAMYSQDQTGKKRKEIVWRNFVTNQSLFEYSKNEVLL